MTVCQIARNDAEPRIVALLEGPLSRKPRETLAEEAPADVGEDAVDIEAVARESIRQFIDRRYKGHDMTRLVGAILNAQGYQIYISPPGADRSVDIVAGRGSLGFDAPRIIVEVKPGDEPADAGMVTRLQGAMRRLHADHGLFVSWSGFKRSSDERELFFEIRLWTGDDLIDQLLAHHDKLPPDVQAEIPLKRIWTLVAEEQDPRHWLAGCQSPLPDLNRGHPDVCHETPVGCSPEDCD
jgi:restriction system protein